MTRKAICITMWASQSRRMREMGIESHNWTIVGSTLICGEGKDIDILCYSNDPKFPMKHGFKPDLEDDTMYDSNFQSWRKGNVNLLVTTNRPYFTSEVTIAAAAALANEPNRFDLNTREGRVEYHRELRMNVANYITPPE